MPNGLTSQIPRIQIDWQLLFNTSKCKCMHLGKKNDKHNYIISEEGQIELEETMEEKDLGIWVDNELGFKDHINKVVNKANSTLGIIRRSYTYLDRQNLVLLYKALVRPLLEITIWKSGKQHK